MTNGALIALIALGYTLVYGIVELINFAHGEVFMMGAFFRLPPSVRSDSSASAGWAQIALVSLVAMLAAMVFSGVLNWSIDRVVYRRLRNAPRLAPLIAAIGISFILQGIGIYWKGSNDGFAAEPDSDRRPLDQHPDRLARTRYADSLPGARSGGHPADDPAAASVSPGSSIAPGPAKRCAPSPRTAAPRH